MRQIKSINQETKAKLEAIIKWDSRYRSRDRAKSILLSIKGKPIGEIADILGYSTRTIYRWFDRFEQSGSLEELSGRGRKAKLKREEYSEIVKECIKKTLI